jgi:DNA-directed RNA polymerase specialized sigma24 family protein
MRDHEAGPESPSSDATRRDDEAKLIADCLRGDRVALTRLVIEYTPWIQSGAQRALKESNSDVALELRDLIQNFFLKLLENLQILMKYNCDHPLGPWLSGIAHFWSTNYLRSRAVRWQDRKAVEIDIEALSLTERPADAPIDPSPIVARILAHFSSTTRDIIQAKYGLGKYGRAERVAEIAQRHGLTNRKVYSYLARVRRVRNVVSDAEVGEIMGFLERGR